MWSCTVFSHPSTWSAPGVVQICMNTTPPSSASCGMYSGIAGRHLGLLVEEVRQHRGELDCLFLGWVVAALVDDGAGAVRGGLSDTCRDEFTQALLPRDAQHGASDLWERFEDRFVGGEGAVVEPGSHRPGGCVAADVLVYVV